MDYNNIIQYVITLTKIIELNNLEKWILNFNVNMIIYFEPNHWNRLIQLKNKILSNSIDIMGHCSFDI